MDTQDALATKITAVTERVAKIGTETRSLLDVIAALQAAIAAGGPVTPAVKDAMAALEARVAVVDQLVADPVVEPPPPPPPAEEGEVPAEQPAP